MLIAKQKRKENIAEYLIYMWQIEDQIRAFKFDINAIQSQIINKYDQPENIKAEIRDWYENLIQLMQNEGIREKGHLVVTKHLLTDLYNTHLYLLKAAKEVKYQTAFATVKAELEILKEKTGLANEIEAAFQFLYGSFLLKLQAKPLNEDTENSLKKISSLIGLLAYRHQRFEQGEEELQL